MTVALSAKDTGDRLEQRFPGSVVESSGESVIVKKESLHDIAVYLKDTEDLQFDYLNYVTAVDYYAYFEVVYQLTSTVHNHSIVIKTRCEGRENPSVPSVIDIWGAADFQEREVYDLMGITFEGHPNLKRIFLWDGFPGHPLRKDFNQ